MVQVTKSEPKSAEYTLIVSEPEYQRIKQGLRQLKLMGLPYRALPVADHLGMLRQAAGCEDASSAAELHERLI